MSALVVLVGVALAAFGATTMVCVKGPETSSSPFMRYQSIV